MKILSKQKLVGVKDREVTRMEIFAPEVAKTARAGQFVIIMVEENGERIPLTVVDKSIEKGTITVIFQEIGLTTRLLGKKDVGESLFAVTGPLGNPTEVKYYGKVILVAGGVGIAEIYPVAKALKEVNNYTLSILGARTREALILEEEIRQISDGIYVVTDDGSYGRKGFVTDILQELLVQENSYNLVYAVGPILMMKKVTELCKKSGVKIIVSLNALMVDGTGMCGCCRVTVNGQTRFTCIDGPEFPGEGVDWEELENRSKMYLEKEKYILRKYRAL
ncbi:MAG: sulfide/dihydroorotate dehydrogenase-like FAD/NAD-binding protein [Candidatus Omnitrophota bacterium]|nr:MAG: sulfide/dihydroorotate dehydrogenase-like FAD/NAD-binding protein [Candidatus Omnitrophota bacterium]